MYTNKFLQSWEFEHMLGLRMVNQTHVWLCVYVRGFVSQETEGRHHLAKLAAVSALDLPATASNTEQLQPTRFSETRIRIPWLQVSNRRR